jgi:energy-coupling factor transport system permease protein
MRSVLAYTPRPGPLQAASPGAAVAYLGSLVAVCFLYSNPIVLIAAGIAVALAGLIAGAADAVRSGLRMGLTLALLIASVNVLVTSRGETVLARLGEWPLLGRVDITGEALTAGAVIGLRAAVVTLAFAVYSACVDPDRVLRALRPFARHSALTATLVSRFVPVAAADAARLRDASGLRGPGAAAVSRSALARRLLAGSLDRAVDVAATLELRGYSLDPPRSRGRRSGRLASLFSRAGRARSAGGDRSRYDGRFYAFAAMVLVTAVAGKIGGGDAFDTYPTVEIGTAPETVVLAAVVLIAGLAPWRRRSSRSTRSLAMEAVRV